MCAHNKHHHWVKKCGRQKTSAMKFVCGKQFSDWCEKLLMRMEKCKLSTMNDFQFRIYAWKKFQDFGYNYSNNSELMHANVNNASA